MDVDELVRDLYGLPLEGFTAARNARARQLKADGSREAARTVQALKKPSVAAWLVNQLVRGDPEQIQLLVELGRELRAGMSGLSADELRLLTKRRYQLISLLVNSALGYAGSRRPGNDVAADVQATLESTLSDPDSADEVLRGCLSGALHVSGFGFTGHPSDVPEEDPLGPDADVVDIGAHRERRAKALEAARARVQEAQQSADEAERRLGALQTTVERAEVAEREAAAEVRRQEVLLERATKALDKRAEMTTRAQAEFEEAEAEAEDAADELAAARAAERRLDR